MKISHSYGDKNCFESGEKSTQTCNQVRSLYSITTVMASVCSMENQVGNISQNYSVYY